MYIASLKTELHLLVLPFSSDVFPPFRNVVITIDNYVTMLMEMPVECSTSLRTVILTYDIM